MCALWLAPVTASAQQDDRAERLAQLRADVTDLSEQVDLEREEMRARLRALDAQKADAQVQLRRVELRLTELRKAADERKEALAGEENTEDALLEPVREGITLLRGVVSTGLPFRTQERLDALDKLEAQIDEGVLRPQKAAHRVWTFFEDELRLTRENALDRQVITLDGEELLVEVARAGMLAMYFRTEDGRIGHAVRSGTDWTWVTYTDSAKIDAVNAFFDALGKQIRVGWFTLPDLIVEE